MHILYNTSKRSWIQTIAVIDQLLAMGMTRPEQIQGSNKVPVIFQSSSGSLPYSFTKNAFSHLNSSLIDQFC